LLGVAANELFEEKLLPEILQLKKDGLPYREIGRRLRLTARQIEHVLSRHRKHSGQ
jgi:hypothetical protein